MNRLRQLFFYFRSVLIKRTQDKYNLPFDSAEQHTGKQSVSYHSSKGLHIPQTLCICFHTRRMLNIRIFAILIAFICFKTEPILSDSCADENLAYFHAGTKTAYNFASGLIQNTSVPNCNAVQIWMMLRHGTRNPGKDEIEDMMKLLPEIRDKVIKNHEMSESGKLCAKDVENLKKWVIHPNLQTAGPKYLTQQGEEDLISIGERFKKYFPELFQADSDDIKPDKYNFRSTETQRTALSMMSFIRGAFGNVSMNTEIVPKKQDTLLKIYEVCKKWLKDDNSLTTDNYAAFIAGPEYEQAIYNISRRLGFAGPLSLDAITTIYKACTFENAWHTDKSSPWCASFTENDLNVFEYEEDLYYYDYISYGNEKTSRIGCTALQDMFNHFTKLENGYSTKEPKGIFYFTHSSMIQLHLKSMGFAKDSIPLKASNYHVMKDNRKWRASNFVPFATNFAAVFYKCDASHKVRFYLNEKPMDYEGCDDGVCDWKYLKEKLGPSAFNCNVEFCKHSNL